MFMDISVQFLLITLLSEYNQLIVQQVFIKKYKYKYSLLR